MNRIITDGSVWLIDDDRKLYWRFPKNEAPRPNEWGGPGAGALQDAVPHPFESWEIKQEPYRQAGRDLAIGIRAIVDAMVEALGPIVAVVQAAAEELGRP